MNLTGWQRDLARACVRDVLARAQLYGHPVPDKLRALDNLFATCDGESESDDAAGQLPENDDLIGTSEAAAILHCTPSWVRQIPADLDGFQRAGRWLFRRRTVVEYAQAKEVGGGAG